MITIIPSIEIIKTNVDNNIAGPGAATRRMALNMATDLMTLANVDILIEGILYGIIEHKLLPEHKLFFEKIYRIDNSAKGVIGYDIQKAIKWIAKSEVQSRKVVIISENPGDFKDACGENIICLASLDFVGRIERAQKLFKEKIFSNLDDALMAMFFI